MESSVQTYGVATNLTLDKRCNLIIVKNAAPVGGAVVLFDDDPLQPGESKVMGGHWRTIYAGRHQISFTGGGAQIAIFTQMYYIEKPNQNC